MVKDKTNVGRERDFMVEKGWTIEAAREKGGRAARVHTFSSRCFIFDCLMNDNYGKIYQNSKCVFFLKFISDFLILFNQIM